MNSKKHKSKSRSKPSKTPQEVRDEVIDVPDENVSKAVEETSEKINIENAEVPEKNIATMPEVKEKQLQSDAPKKPKRNKGKKKADTWNEEKESDPIIIDAMSKDDQSKEAFEIEAQEAASIVPVARKKKNKSKKKVDQPKVDTELQVVEVEKKDIEEKDFGVKVEENIDAHKEIEIAEAVKKDDHMQKDSLVPKKKKKKKNRHDSEKSDVNDPCTLAFQKLLGPSDGVNEKTGIEAEALENNTNVTEDIAISISDILLNPSQDFEENINDEGSKSKKKNKKVKKNTPEMDININEDNKAEHNEDTVIIKDDHIQLDQSEDCSLKPKAKIVKPVQKKRKTKSEFLEVNIPLSTEGNAENKTEECTCEFTPSKSEILIDAESKEKQTDISVTEIKLVDNTAGMLQLVTSPINIAEKTDFSQVISSIETTNIDLKNQSVGDDKPELSEIMESKQEIDMISKESDCSGFVEVKIGKHKKKRQNIDSGTLVVEPVPIMVEKPTKDSQSKMEEVISDIDKKEPFFDILQLDIDENIKKSEELETLNIITPDLIQYPRSTSQQHLDDNNNTIIEEISTAEEVKLGIPIFTTPPIIQGSGESPDKKSNKEPITIKIMEVEETNTNQNNEKNDIKSRIFEVNKDMEELRRSIERSLAELTGVEKTDSEVDKEFDELFQSQIEESQIPPQNKTKQSEKENFDTLLTQCDKEGIEVKTSEEKKIEFLSNKTVDIENKIQEVEEQITHDIQSSVPVCPARSKGKGKSKKKGKKNLQCVSSNTSNIQQTEILNKDTSTSTKEKSEQKSESSSSKEKGKQRATGTDNDSQVTSKQLKLDLSFEPIENFEDALTSSADDVNKTFEIIANEAAESLRQNNPQINIIAPTDGTEEKGKEEKKQKKNPASPPKNLLDKPKIPASSDKNDYKKEKNKPPSSIQAKVKIKDSVEIDKVVNKNSKESQTDNNRKPVKEVNGYDTYSYISNTNDDFVYKYSFRKVFLQSSCNVCKKDLILRLPCKFCSLVFYCSQKHLDEDLTKHQFLCFAVSTIAHLKEQKHIYADAQNITGHEYRVLRMQMILSCEKILKRKLVPWEQEALLYPRICADASCRQWKQRLLKDCKGCGQVSYCIDHPDHLPSSHQRWCKSYALYQKLVNYQQTKGRLEPKLPTKVMDSYKMSDKINEILGCMYEEKVDMDDIQYAALTQLASGPLTAAYSYQFYTSKMNTKCANGVSKKSTFTIHAVGTELQFEADALNKWEIFFLHLRPDVQNLRVVLVGPDLNPSKLPLDLLGKIKLCENCQTNKRRVLFSFHDKKTYHDYYSSDDFVTPDIVCAFNPNIQRSCIYNEIWPPTINSILKQKIPFILTSHTLEELERDLKTIKEHSRYNFNVISEPKHNPFSSLRPDRNFITDHEIPLLFKNYCFSILCGAL